MKPARKFEVYQERIPVVSGPVGGPLELVPQPWRWRCRSTRNGQIVSGSQENFDSPANAMRAARTEASHYQAGKDVVVKA